MTSAYHAIYRSLLEAACALFEGDNRAFRNCLGNGSERGTQRAWRRRLREATR